MTTNEIWKAIPGYEGLYEVSDQGRVRSLDRYVTRRSGSTCLIRGKILQQVKIGRGYYSVNLCITGKAKRFYVHQLVVMAFKPSCSGYAQVNHIDGIKTNNDVSNLEWCTPSENIRHALNTGLIVTAVGSRNGLAKLTEADIPDIRRRLANNETTRSIGKIYGVSNNVISLINTGKIWKHVE